MWTRKVTLYLSEDDTKATGLEKIGRFFSTFVPGKRHNVTFNDADSSVPTHLSTTDHRQSKKRFFAFGRNGIPSAKTERSMLWDKHHNTLNLVEDYNQILQGEALISVGLFLDTKPELLRRFKIDDDNTLLDSYVTACFNYISREKEYNDWSTEPMAMFFAVMHHAQERQRMSQIQFLMKTSGGIHFHGTAR